MPPYWVEGLYIPPPALKRARRSGRAPTEVEPFARVVWADSPEEALQLATQELGGGEWAEGPQVSQTTEADRMRAQGAPMLPGLGAAPARRRSGRASRSS